MPSTHSIGLHKEARAHVFLGVTRQSRWLRFVQLKELISFLSTGCFWIVKAPGSSESRLMEALQETFPFQRRMCPDSFGDINAGTSSKRAENRIGFFPDASSWRVAPPPNRLAQRFRRCRSKSFLPMEIPRLWPLWLDALNLSDGKSVFHLGCEQVMHCHHRGNRTRHGEVTAAEVDQRSRRKRGRAQPGLSQRPGRLDGDGGNTMAPLYLSVV